MSIYGIDLGTTNSLIALGDKWISDMIPSIVDIKTKSVGSKERLNTEAVRSFKVDISLAIEGGMSVLASEHVLRELKRQVKDDVVKDVVISVPAYFSDNQRQATIRAAKNAGLNVVRLVNEPTAAAMYISKASKALSLVFDLGGGTFDVSVIDSRFGNYDVQATDGCIVGGDNFDNAIMRHIIKSCKVPTHKLGKNRLTLLLLKANKAKIDVQKYGKATVELDGFDVMPELSTFELTGDTYIQLMKMTFAETISKMKKVIGEAIAFDESYKILLVGGSTRCPYLRKWIEEETGVAPSPLTYDPDKVVAQGAALLGELIETGKADEVVSDVTNQLSIGLADGTVKVLITKNSKIPVAETTLILNDSTSQFMKVKLYQGDSTLAVNNECIGELVYDYGEVKEKYTGDIIVKIEVESSGVINFSCQELLKPPVTITLDRSLSEVK